MTTPLLGPVPSGALHVMTWNIRRRASLPSWRRADRWSERAPRLVAVLQAERPTILAAQEVLPDQAETVLAALGPDHRFVGHGRSVASDSDATPRGEASPLFYDTARLELRDWRQEALSERPEVAGSRSWGSAFPRVAVQARFRDRRTGVEFLAVSTHLDVLSPAARRHGAAQIRRTVEERGLPAIVMGDLNAGPDSAPARMLRHGGTLRDAWPASAERATPEWATYAGYRPPRPGIRIDAMLVSPDVRVPRIGIDARPVDGAWPSDHLPIHAHLQLPTPEEDR